MEHTLNMFKLCCMCLSYIFPVLSSVRITYSMRGTKTVDLSSLIEPLQSYLPCGELVINFFADPEPIVRCVKLVENFGDQVLRARYGQWDSIKFHGRAVIVQEFSKSYKAVPAANDVDTSSMSLNLQSPEKLAMKRRTPAQSPKIDLAMTAHAGTASALVSKLGSQKKRSGDNE